MSGELESLKKEEKNYIIQLMRMVFCVMIINYHFYSHYLLSSDLPNYCSRGYLGDEFFFIISGYYLAKQAYKTKIGPVEWTKQYISNRVKKIIPCYYITWAICFLSTNVISIARKQINVEDIGVRLLNSIYELSFVEMLGFTKGYYCNQVGWFFSALIICAFLICPWMVKYKKAYIQYVAPLLSFASIALLSMNYDYLHNPYEILPNLFLMKGSLRAFAMINLGAFLFGLSIGNVSIIKCICEKYKHTSFTAWIIGFLTLLGYMVYPHSSNSAPLMVQYDYLFALLLALLIFFCFNSGWNEVIKDKYKAIFDCLGRFSYYIFFSQAIVYTFDRASCMM